MRKLIKFTLIFVLIAAIFPSCVSKKKFTELMSSKETVDATLAQTQSKVKMLEGENEDLMNQKTELESKNGSLTSELATAKSKLDRASKDLSSAKASLSKTESKLTAAQTSIKGVFDSYSGTDLSVSERDNRLYVKLAEPVTFKSGSTRVARKYKDVINSLAEVLKANPQLQIQVEGHSDNAKFIAGVNGSNWSLSMNRAMSAVNMLLRAGVSPNQLSAVGRGEFAPTSGEDVDSKEARAQNRRVEFLVVPKISSISSMGVNP